MEIFTLLFPLTTFSSLTCQKKKRRRKKEGEKWGEKNILKARRLGHLDYNVLVRESLNRHLRY